MIRQTQMAVLLMLTACACSVAEAELKFSPVFGDHMVVQRNKPIHVWGWTSPSQSVSVQLADKSASVTADDTGRFDISLDALPAGGPHEMTIKADESVTFKDVLVGEVWVCSGQSLSLIHI